MNSIMLLQQLIVQLCSRTSTAGPPLWLCESVA